MQEGPEKIKIKSDSLSTLRLNELKMLLPGIFADGIIDAHLLAQHVGVEVSGLQPKDETFGLNWAGKKDSITALHEPSWATLKPQIDQSVGWDNSENVFIEGDNLEVLKILQKSYNDQIKLIYIDPPYNTGNEEFVYKDEYLVLSSSDWHGERNSSPKES